MFLQSFSGFPVFWAICDGPAQADAKYLKKGNTMTAIQMSESIRELRYSVIREMGQLADGMPDVINLGIGEPDFPTPPQITARAFEDARNGCTHYTPSQGDPELLQKLADLLSTTSGRPVTPAMILVTHGAMGALSAAFRTLLEPGDEVLLLEPHFPDYLAHIIFARGCAVPVETRFDQGFLPDPDRIEAAITPRTRILLLNSPNNPTGSVLPGELLDRIAEIARRRNLVVISDEVYDRITFTGRPESIYTRPGMDRQTLVIKSFSKTYAMTGWRIGFCYGPESLISQMLKVVNYSTACASSVGQRAAIAALDLDPGIIEQMTAVFEQRVNLVCDRLAAMPGIRLVRPHGSFYVFADIHRIHPESREFTVRLLNSEQVVVVPGYAFGNSCEGCIRIACTLPRERLNQAMDRLQKFVTGHGGTLK
jgi:aspartate/methionine/tyrosine aminotransferase